MSHPDYHVKANGEVVMSFDMFKSLKFEAICKTLGMTAGDIREAK